MNLAVAGLAVIVSVMYVLIAAVVVPQLARIAIQGSRSTAVIVAAVGAGTFFLGCAVTHLVIAYRELDAPHMDHGHDVGDLLGHIVPHIAQIVGGVTFIVLARRRLDVRIIRRDDTARVAELEGRLEHALEAGRLGAWEVNLQNGQTWHSPQHDRIFGYDTPPARWCLETMLDQVAASQRDSVREQLALTTQAPTVDLDCEIVRHDGETRWVTISGALHLDDTGSPSRVIGTVADITERRHREHERAELEEQLHHWQRVEAVGRLASGVAHDFNNVLAVVRGWADVIVRTPGADAEIIEQAQAIAAAADHGRELTGQLLAVARHESAEAETVDVNRIAADALVMLQRLIDNDIRIRADLHDIPPIRINPTHLTQILINLAINARDAMPAGGEIAIATSAVEAPAPRVAIRVSDTGHGIAPDVLARLFDPYFTTKPAGSGTGLGLSIVETLVHQANGTITVDSRTGEGAAFTLTFPPAAPPVASSTLVPVP